MTPDELRDILDANFAGSKMDIAAAIGVNMATVYNWLNRRNKIPRPTALAIRALVAKRNER